MTDRRAFTVKDFEAYHAFIDESIVMYRKRYLEGRTFQSIADEYGLTKQGVAHRINSLKSRINNAVRAKEKGGRDE